MENFYKLRTKEFVRQFESSLMVTQNYRCFSDRNSAKLPIALRFPFFQNIIVATHSTFPINRAICLERVDFNADAS